MKQVKITAQFEAAYKARIVKDVALKQAFLAALESFLVFTQQAQA